MRWKVCVGGASRHNMPGQGLGVLAQVIRVGMGPAPMHSRCAIIQGGALSHVWSRGALGDVLMFAEHGGVPTIAPCLAGPGRRFAAASSRDLLSRRGTLPDAPLVRALAAWRLRSWLCTISSAVSGFVLALFAGCSALRSQTGA